MGELHHQIRVRGPEGFKAGLSPVLAGPLLDAVGASIDSAVRMAFGGRSRAPGRRRTWLNEAADVRLQDIDRGDELVLHFTARPFGEILELAKEMYSQIEMWPSKPEPKCSAIDTLAAVIDDVAAEREESTRFDVSLLRRLQRFKKVVGEGIESIRVEAKHRGPNRRAGFVVLDPPVLEHARSLSAATPRPKESRVDGVLDMIRQSTRSFAIKLDDGEEARGVLLDGDVTQARSLFGKRVSVQGSAAFRPFGRLLRSTRERSSLARSSRPSGPSSRRRGQHAHRTSGNAYRRRRPLE